MKLRNIIIFLVAVLIGVGATWFANSWIIGRLSVDTASEENTRPVVVAALEVAYGQQIDETHIKIVLWPEDIIPSGVFHEKADALGKIANQRIVPGEPVLESEHLLHVLLDEDGGL